MLTVSGPSDEPMAAPSILFVQITVKLEELVFSCNCKQLD